MTLVNIGNIAVTVDMGISRCFREDYIYGLLVWISVSLITPKEYLSLWEILNSANID